MTEAASPLRLTVRAIRVANPEDRYGSGGRQRHQRHQRQREAAGGVPDCTHRERRTEPGEIADRIDLGKAGALGILWMLLLSLVVVLYLRFGMGDEEMSA